MRVFAAAAVCLLCGSVLGARAVRAELVQIEFGGVISEAAAPEDSRLPEPATAGDRFTGSLTFQTDDVELRTIEDGTYVYRVLNAAPPELSFGGLSSWTAWDSYSGDGVVNPPDCPATCDYWQMNGNANPGGPLVTYVQFAFRDDTASQVTGNSFTFPNERSDWTLAGLTVFTQDLSTFDTQLEASADIDTWHAVPEPADTTPLAAFALSLLPALRRGASRKPKLA